MHGSAGPAAETCARCSSLPRDPVAGRRHCSQAPAQLPCPALPSRSPHLVVPWPAAAQHRALIRLHRHKLQRWVALAQVAPRASDGACGAAGVRITRVAAAGAGRHPWLLQGGNSMQQWRSVLALLECMEKARPGHCHPGPLTAGADARHQDVHPAT